MPNIPRLRILSSLGVLLLCAASLPAAATPYVASVVQDNAEVRCKPSVKPEMYPTNHLAKGARVLVLEERTDGWLGILPPQDSFSWIDSRQVERIVSTQENWVVKSDGVPVLIGSRIISLPPSVEGVRLARGTQVHVMGQGELAGNATLLPIDPPAGEVRYIRADAVRLEPGAVVPSTPAVRAADPAKTVSAIPVSHGSFSSPGGTVSQTALSIPAPQPASTPGLPANATPWQKAEYYERAGHYQDAINTYDQLSKDLSRQNPTWADFAHKRATYLANGGREPLNMYSMQQAVDVRATTSTFQPAVQQTAPPQVRLLPPADPNAAPSQTMQTSSWSTPQTNQVARSGAGRLVISAYYRTGGPPYRLETVDGYIYASAAPGVDLSAYVDHSVELFGTKQYSGDLRAYYMVVSHVQPQ